ncbi:MAG: MGH1-like glycoside hydrolase domain-containing protein, partial [Janthinobacterium lividum]
MFDEKVLAQQAFGNDAPWYLENIPFLEIDDAEIQQTYYYRWQVYRSHLRQIGPEGTDETEFLPSVPWARAPYEDLNDSSSFHIHEGRWLRNPIYVQSLVDHLYAGSGNDRHFSESIAAATLAWTQVTGDAAPALRNLNAMEYVFNAWDDHFDRARNLYWIEPLLDATEYTIGSIDASGAGFQTVSPPQDNGFTGGFAFRPSINAYQYGNARAIAEFARMSGQVEVEKDYRARAAALRSALLEQLWNPPLQHFMDLYQRTTKTVTAGEFIRGRELVGMVPWQFELPPTRPTSDAPHYQTAWQHVLSPDKLGGKYGVRTVEPTYPKYMVQYRYDAVTGLRECQWNGPSWPFQSSQMLSGLANLLQDYEHPGVSATEYTHLLRQYTAQHRLASGVLDLQEDYNPDTGGPIVGLPRSHHYNHSTYVDLVLSGLLGIRPHSDNVFEINPLLPPPGSAERPILYFALKHLQYHGHDLTVIFDADGSRYHVPPGVSVFV